MKWINVFVGDIIWVEFEEFFLVDLVLVVSLELEGLCYIEIVNLDGEINLKIKQVLFEMLIMVSLSDFGRLGGRIKFEQFNSSFYIYEVILMMQVGGGEKELFLNFEQLLFCGVILCNIFWIYGVVVFIGYEIKFM